VNRRSVRPRWFSPELLAILAGGRFQAALRETGGSALSVAETVLACAEAYQSMTDRGNTGLGSRRMRLRQCCGARPLPADSMATLHTPCCPQQDTASCRRGRGMSPAHHARDRRAAPDRARPPSSILPKPLMSHQTRSTITSGISGTDRRLHACRHDPVCRRAQTARQG
jgi:hypothetical protein